jgi:hypothetical protein
MTSHAGIGTFYEGQDVLLLAQLYTQESALLTPADVDPAATVTVKVFDLTTSTPSTAIVSDTSLDCSDVVFTATTSVGWYEDSIGANFGIRLYDNAANDSGDAGVVVFDSTDATGGHVYLVEVTFPTLDSGLAVLRWRLQCHELLGV